MTISSTTRVAGPFAGDGTTATFPFTFKVFEDSDLYVVTLNVATGVLTVLALTTDYTATLNADQNNSPGGSITLTAGNLASGLTLTITTGMEQLQGLDLTNGGGFYPDVINAALDTLTILTQQLGVTSARSLQAPVVDASPGMVLPPAADRASKVLSFDGSGNVSMMAVTTVNAGTLTYAIAPKTANYTMTAADTTILADTTGGAFTITLPAAPANGALIYIKQINASKRLIIAGNGKLIEGVANVFLTTRDSSLSLQFDGTSWRIL